MSLTTLQVNNEDYVSYADIDEADTALAVDPVRSSVWGALDEDEKRINLIAATFRLDLLSWLGEKTGGAEQHNAFPRTGLSYQDGTDVPDDGLPYDVQVASILLAGNIATDATQSAIGRAEANVRRLRAGSAEIEFVGRANAEENLNQLSDMTIQALVKRWLAGSGIATGIGNAAYGTDEQSQSLRYDRIRGFG